MTKVTLSCGDTINVECSCEPTPVTVRSSDGVVEQVDVFTATDGMHCPHIAVKRSHDDEDLAYTFSAAYPGVDDEGNVCIILDKEFPNRKVKVRSNNTGGATIADMAPDITLGNFMGDSMYILLETVIAGFSATELKAAMTPSMRTALGAILP